jgi:hypothetical protein
MGDQEVIEVEDENAAEPPVETSDKAVDTAPDEQPAQEAPEDDKQKAIAKYAYEARVAERKAKDLQQKLVALEAKSTQKARPDVPSLPDPMSLSDDQFRDQLKQRDAAIAERADWDAQRRILGDMQQKAAQARERQQQEDWYKAQETYTARVHQIYSGGGAGV